METTQKIGLIEEMLELDEGALSEETLLETVEQWDSMSKLSLIVLLDDEFGVQVNSDQIKALRSVKDILTLMSV